MTQKFEFKDPLNFPVDVVLQAMLDTDFLRRWTEVQQGLNPVVTIKERSEKKAVVVIDLEEPLPKPLGTMKATMVFEWDLTTKSMKWRREGKDGMSKTSNVYGETRLESTGAKTCTLVEIINIDVPIPLLGKKIESGIAAYLKDGRPAKLDFLRKHLS